MEENSTVTVNRVAMKWGFIVGLISVALTIVIDLVGLTGNQVIQWVGLLIFGVIVFIAHREFKNDGDGYMTYGQGLGLGTLMAVVSSGISSVFTFVYVLYIDSSIIDVAREKAISDMESSGSNDAEIEQAMVYVEQFTSPLWITIISLVVGVFLGFIISLIISAITQKKSPENELI